MKKLLLAAIFILCSAKVYAGGNISTDIFPYENKHSSFTVDIDMAKLNRMSIEVVASTPTILDARFGNAAISTSDDTILLTSHGFATAMPVLLSTAPAAAPSPLTTGTTYFAVKISDNLIKLATTYAQAVSGDTIDILTAPAGDWTLRPIALSLTGAGYLWYGSNDGTNFVGVSASGFSVNGSTQSLATIGTGVRLFDWGEFSYRFLRFTFAGPSAGVIKLRAYLFAKES